MVDKVFFLDLGDDYKSTTPLGGEIFCIYALFYNKKFKNISATVKDKRMNWEYGPCENTYIIEAKYIFTDLSILCLMGYLDEDDVGGSGEDKSEIIPTQQRLSSSLVHYENY